MKRDQSCGETGETLKGNPEQQRDCSPTTLLPDLIHDPLTMYSINTIRFDIVLILVKIVVPVDLMIFTRTCVGCLLDSHATAGGRRGARDNTHVPDVTTGKLDDLTLAHFEVIGKHEATRGSCLNSCRVSSG